MKTANKNREEIIKLIQLIENMMIGSMTTNRQKVMNDYPFIRSVVDSAKNRVKNIGSITNSTHRDKRNKISILNKKLESHINIIKSSYCLYYKTKKHPKWMIRNMSNNKISFYETVIDEMLKMNMSFLNKMKDFSGFCIADLQRALYEYECALSLTTNKFNDTIECSNLRDILIGILGLFGLSKYEVKRGLE